MDSPITSLQNARIKSLIRLRTRDGRQQQQRFTIDGQREIQRALQCHWDFPEFYVCPSRCNQRDQQLCNDLLRHGAEQITVTPEVMDKIAYGQRTLPLVAVAGTRTPPPLDSLDLSANSLILVLEGIEKPGNLGAITRAADAGGATAVILADSICDIFNPNAIRASAGALFQLPILQQRSIEIQRWLQTNQFQTFSTRVDGAQNYSNVDLTGRTCIVLGTEATGLSDQWNHSNSTEIALPMLGAGDSLNVSTTAAILIYESLRQRELGKSD